MFADQEAARAALRKGFQISKIPPFPPMPVRPPDGSIPRVPRTSAQISARNGGLPRLNFNTLKPGQFRAFKLSLPKIPPGLGLDFRGHFFGRTPSGSKPWRPSATNQPERRSAAVIVCRLAYRIPKCCQRWADRYTLTTCPRRSRPLCDPAVIRKAQMQRPDAKARTPACNSNLQCCLKAIVTR